MRPDIRIKDYDYPLPDEKIAKYPLEKRDNSKLLIYKTEGRIDDSVFHELPDVLPENSIMVFNDTKVVPARMRFHRQTGAQIEIFCLQPSDPSDYNLSFASEGRCSWHCVIGNAKRWKDDIIECDAVPGLTARLVSRDGESGVVEFCWTGGSSFSSILDQAGNVPIPPYLNRDSEVIDRERYQTTYARIRGSVAAPTAGLHFTQDTLRRIRERGIDIENVCLHVGAGTFLPVKSDTVAGHPMHREPFTITLECLRKLRDAKISGRKVVCVGTTSMRTLESLYYLGVRCMENGCPSDVEQWDPYDREYGYTLIDALDGIIQYLEKEGLDSITVGTRIIIVPGFRFRLVDVLVTNFHQPQSTLILLVSAFVRGDWRSIYEHALTNNYRFLSYGDSSVLFREDDQI